MTLLLVFVGCLFTAYALWLAVAPFVGGADEGLRLEHLDDEIREIELLVSQREVLITALRELDFDRETEKLAADDYETFRRRYEQQAVLIMRRLDEIHGGRDWRARVDAELTDRLGHAPTLLGAEAPAPRDTTQAEQSADVVPDDDGAEPDAATAQESDAADEAPGESLDTPAPEEDAEPEQTATPELEESEGEDALADVACGACGEALESDDRFCSQCGAPVGVHESEPTPVKSEANA